jgi:DNA (cytosine-5)-methyltransferase 1
VKFIDLFAGIGGFRFGMESAGHECVAFCEIDKFARASYKAIHNTEGEIELHDITQVTDEEIRNIGHVDAICGGFPCQAFSIAGNRRGFEDTRGTLFFEIARFASILKPKYLFLENVKGLLNHDKGDTFEVILSALDELGYDVEWQVLNSKDFGVPQNRERVFIIGHLRGERGRKIFPIGGENEKSSAERLGINILGNTKNPNGTAQGTRDIVHDPKGIVGTLTAADYKGPKQVDIPVQPKIRVREATKQGYAEASVGDSVNLAHPNSKTRRGRVGKQIANTLLTGESQGVVEPSFRIRKLTPRECWRLQGFPDWAFDKAQEVNSNSQLYKQAGNSVTVNVIKEIARYL